MPTSHLSPDVFVSNCVFSLPSLRIDSRTELSSAENLTLNSLFSTLNQAKPIIEYLPGFKQDISKARKLEDLPKEAIDYIKYIEEKTECKIKYISVGPERDAYIEV